MVRLHSTLQFAGTMLMYSWFSTIILERKISTTKILDL